MLLFVLAACDDGGKAAENKDKQALEEASVVLDWTPNTNHTGIYVAKEKGYFAEEGLEVDIMLPGEAGANQLVASGKAAFGVSYQEGVTEARTQDIPLVSIAAVIQHNTSGFASLEKENITSPKDFEGKTYGGWGAPIDEAVLTSLMNGENANADNVENINMGNTDFFTAVKRDIDFAWIYYGWTGVEAELRGMDLNIVWLTDYSKKLDYYTPVLITNEDMIGNDPEKVQKFMAAVSKGYQFAIDKPDKAAAILIKAVPDLDPELVKASQEWLSPKYQDDAAQWGMQKSEVWKDYADWMYSNGLLDKELNVGASFTNEFLPEQEETK